MWAVNVQLPGGLAARYRSPSARRRRFSGVDRKVGVAGLAVGPRHSHFLRRYHLQRAVADLVVGGAHSQQWFDRTALQARQVEGENEAALGGSGAIRVKPGDVRSRQAV